MNSAGNPRKYHYAVLKSNSPMGATLVCPNGTNIQESDLFVCKTDPKRQVVFFAMKEQQPYHNVKDLVPGGYVTQFKGPHAGDDMRQYAYLLGSYTEKRDFDHIPGVRRVNIQTFLNPGTCTGTKFGVDECGNQFVESEIHREPDTKRNREE